MVLSNCFVLMGFFLFFFQFEYINFIIFFVFTEARQKFSCTKGLHVRFNDVLKRLLRAANFFHNNFKRDIKLAIFLNVRRNELIHDR